MIVYFSLMIIYFHSWSYNLCIPFKHDLHCASFCGLDSVFKRKRREKRAQRRSCSKGLQRLLYHPIRKCTIRCENTKIYVGLSFEVVLFFYCRKLCTLEIVPVMLPVFWIVYLQLKERIISPINYPSFSIWLFAYSQDRTLSRSNTSTGSYNSPAARFS